jgi:hypothetical protein
MKRIMPIMQEKTREGKRMANTIMIQDKEEVETHSELTSEYPID